jgi:hypothetical protein
MSLSPINVPVLIGGFTAFGLLIVGAWFLPQLLEVRAEYQQRRRNGFTAQTHHSRRPPIPSRCNVPPLALDSIELDILPVIHITRSPTGNTHQEDGTRVVEQDPEREAVWEAGKAV